MHDPTTASTLLAFYEHQVLPALYQRLDRAFPELEWTWTGEGWKGVKKTDSGYYNRFDCTAIVSNHPWGFVTRAGAATSWLAYINGGGMPSGADLDRAIYKLATLAGVDVPPRGIHWTEQTPPPFTAAPNRPAASSYNPFAEPAFASRTPAAEVFETRDPWTRVVEEPVSPPAAMLSPAVAPIPWQAHQQRQNELWESFVAFCHSYLCSPAGEDARHKLDTHCGVDAQRGDYLPIGAYPSVQEVDDYLQAAGFSAEEIATAAVSSDSRLNGRVIIPWRDSLGRIATIIAEDVTQDERSTGRRLYIKGGARPAVFGLDVALRPSAGGAEHLILVDSVLAVIYFHQHGIPNVAMMAGSTRAPLKRDWEILADLGVRSVTLALSDDAGGSARTCKSVMESCHAENAPDVYSLPYGCLETCLDVADYARMHGLHRVSELITQRQHAYRYLGAALVRRHRPGRKWSEPSKAALLGEAVAFDAAVYTREREVLLDQHFWGEILEAAGLKWETIRRQLKHRPSVLPMPKAEVWHNDQPIAPVHWQPTAKVEDIEWINSVLNSTANEQAEKWSPVWPDSRPRPHLPRMHAETSYTYDDIRARAYALWEQKGRPFGAEQQCWYEAEQSLRRGGGNRAA